MGLNVLPVLTIQLPGTASMSGEILDPSGAVIQQSSLALRRPASEQEWRHRADAGGHYAPLRLSPAKPGTRKGEHHE